MGIFVAAPLVAATLATAWPAARKAMLSLSLPLLVGLNIGRVFAVVFLMVAAEGRLSGPFPHSAGMGRHHQRRRGAAVDLARPRSRAEQDVLHLWNAFGMLDLVAAIVLGVMSAPARCCRCSPIRAPRP